MYFKIASVRVHFVLTILFVWIVLPQFSFSMVMTGANIFLALIVFLCYSFFTGQLALGKSDGYVREACGVTRYQDLCIHSLAPFASSAKRSPSRWARAGVSVALREAERVARYLERLKRGGQVKGRRQRGALSDCIENFQDTIDNLHRSLRILRDLTRERFNSEMGDLITWMSSALTDEDTCLDGFDEQKARTQVKPLRQKVAKVTYLTSNALALANKLASTGNLE